MTVTTLSYVIVGAAMLALGILLGRALVFQQVKSGRLIHGGRIYWCKDTGPIIR